MKPVGGTYRSEGGRARTTTESCSHACNGSQPQKATGSKAGVLESRIAEEREGRMGNPTRNGGIDYQEITFPRSHPPPERWRRRNA